MAFTDVDWEKTNFSDMILRINEKKYFSRGFNFANQRKTNFCENLFLKIRKKNSRGFILWMRGWFLKFAKTSPHEGFYL